MRLDSSFASLFIALLPLAGCVESPAGEGGEDLGVAQQAETTENGLEWNGITSNGITSNGITSNGITSNGITSNGLVMDALSDPLSRKFLKYVVSCALRPDQEIDLVIDDVPYTFTGQLGLAPEWGLDGGSCDDDCRAWVSSCVLSRVNYLGVSVSVSLRGRARSLASTAEERAAYPNREATYYGDIFSFPQKRYACLSPGSTLISRVCGPTTDGCVVTVVGDCDRVCGGVDPTEGSFRSCRDDQGSTYPSAVTIFRQ